MIRYGVVRNAERVCDPLVARLGSTLPVPYRSSGAAGLKRCRDGPSKMFFSGMNRADRLNQLVVRNIFFEITIHSRTNARRMSSSPL